MSLKKRLLAGIWSAALALCLCAPAALAAGDRVLGLYFTTDLYGRWYGADPNTDRTEDVNYLKVASTLTSQGRRDDVRLLVDGGNSAQGGATTYQMELARGGHTPVALSLRYIGYDAFLPGTGERELTAEERKAFYGSLTDAAGSLSGTPVAVLQAESAGEEEHTAPFLVRSYPLDDGEFRVGLISLEEGGDWRQFRQDHSCDLLVAVIPSGMTQGNVVELIGATDGVDLVLMNGDGVSGAISLRDLRGRPVPVIRGSEGSLTRTEILVKGDGKFTLGKSESLDLRARRNEDGLGALLAPYYEKARSLGGQELGVLSGVWDWNMDLTLAPSDTMNFIHEAQLWATGAQLSIAAPAVEGEFCMAQLLEGKGSAGLDRRSCWTIYPNEMDRLLVVEMTGLELRQWLEDCAGKYTAAEDGTVAGAAGISQVYGLSYVLCLGDPQGQRVAAMSYLGRPVTEEEHFYVAVSEGTLAAAGRAGTYPVRWEAFHTAQFRGVGGAVSWILGEYIRSQTGEGRQILPPQARSVWTVRPGTGGELLAGVTRLEFVEALHAAAGSPGAKQVRADFSDVPRAGWTSSTALDWAVETGVVQGNGGGLFAPGVPISREQAAIMLLRYDLARNLGPTGSWAVAVPYTDAPQISVWASEAIMWNVIRNYLPQDDAGNFHPQATVTAMELEGILERLGG